MIAAVHPAAAGLSFLAGYLLGSIPFGLIFTRLAGAGDVRKIGSGNIGATNVLRTGKKWAAALTLIFDAGKGAAAVLLAGTFYGMDGAVFAGLGAFLGHIFPVWLGFKGGKGMATFLGVILAMAWPVGLVVAATWLAAAAIWRISSLSALVAAALAPLYMYMWLPHAPIAAGLAALLALILFVTHRENIQRLLSGSEPRIGRA
ncbi:MAG: glycerol-3-phosphate 1-O-acyltransferase PlsY [Alphaproteobacteria bacterium]|nr:glycerol-3-phosphate 1-O-acyltransferase PlsY [Alphaproteobacteria bacterium]MBV9694015.1 glycerol-3-phosphate 1-O-acyltransferase PlsY [Alphaproteobacteria bacterium]